MPEPESLLTIGEVAARARHLAKDAFSFSERARHWAKLGLLVAVENVGEGAGKHALFRASEAYMAAVLNGLAKAGLQPAGSGAAVECARFALAGWLEERAKGQPAAMRLEIRVYLSGHSAMEVLRGEEKWEWKPEEITMQKAKGPDLTNAPVESVFTLDLGLLFESVFEAAKGRTQG
jgi:hypothetical protein